MNLVFNKFKQLLIIACLAIFCVACSSVPSVSANPWQVVDLTTDASLYDVGFTDNPDHGWIVGSRSSIFETTDGGQTWEPRIIDLGEEKVSFLSVSFAGQEGWIVGKPSILLHTDDGGAHWTRVILSSKLPGSPYMITALGPDSAELATDLGAIYRTDDGARNWHALVQGSVGVVRNMTRSPAGDYLAVSAKGNFYSTWHPGDDEWAPHQRTSSRRLQNMGFIEDGRQWLIARGGQLQFSQPEAGAEDEAWGEEIYPEFSTSWGLLDVAYRTPEELWVSGGSGNLLVSFDQGETWQKDREVESVPANLYRIVFFDAEHGFILGDRGALLRYEPSDEIA
jgi:photosystem II stability/assembly factor-like uncharacterized protein